MIFGRLGFLLALSLLISIAASTTTVFALEIPFPGENGFLIGVPQDFLIVASTNKELLGTVGIFVFGASKLKIGEQEYDDCLFEYEGGTAHFYFSIDSNNQALLQKGFTIGKTEIDINPAITILAYPLQPNKERNAQAIVTVRNAAIGNFVFPLLTLQNVQAQTFCFNSSITVPAGTFEAILVESNWAGKMLGEIPLTVRERIWLNAQNVFLKLEFELQVASEKPVKLFGMELMNLPACRIPKQYNKTVCWAKIKTQ